MLRSGARFVLSASSLACLSALLGCPQLLEDDFELLTSTRDAGSLGCEAPSCLPAGGASGNGGSGGGSGAGGTSSGGTSSGGSGPGGAGGTAGSDGAAGSDMGGAAGSGGAGGTTDAGGASGSGGDSGSGGAGGGAGGSSAGVGGSGGAGSSGGSGGSSGGAGGETGDECRVILLEDETHYAEDNCLGIFGWNDTVSDSEDSTNPGSTLISQTYEGGNVCFEGTVYNHHWGATYSLTLADTAVWDPAPRDVSGFQFEASGAKLPPSLDVIYVNENGSDFCRVITPSAAVAVPLSSAHPNCSTNPDASSPSRLKFIRLHFPLATTASYQVDFCLRIRALP